mmetsp:Transcript_145844/g.406226  ORF Transcript_145844/g.406226 Transcript_145844/m.406226 type:complete len:241 (-) Transcript_145844:636-1358(-)
MAHLSREPDPPHWPAQQLVVGGRDANGPVRVGPLEERIRVPLGDEHLDGVGHALVRVHGSQDRHDFSPGCILRLSLDAQRLEVGHGDHVDVGRAGAKVDLGIHVLPQGVVAASIVDIHLELRVVPEVLRKFKEYPHVGVHVKLVNLFQLPVRQRRVEVDQLILQNTHAEGDDDVFALEGLAIFGCHSNTGAALRLSDVRHNFAEPDLAREPGIGGPTLEQGIPTALVGHTAVGILEVFVH